MLLGGSFLKLIWPLCLSLAPRPPLVSMNWCGMSLAFNLLIISEKHFVFGSFLLSVKWSLQVAMACTPIWDHMGPGRASGAQKSLIRPLRVL